MKAAAAEKPTETVVKITTRPLPIASPIFKLNAVLMIAAGTILEVDGRTHAFTDDTPVTMPALDAGSDYFIRLNDGVPEAFAATVLDLDGVAGGFHYAPGGNATARQGGDDVPAINPFSIWDAGFRPACADPRGMTCIGGKFWCDIYLLGTAPFEDGTSKFGTTIADGTAPPTKQKTGRYKKLDQPTAIEIYAALGKSLMSPEEFFAAAFGVTEGTSLGDDPQTTQLDAPRTSKWGVMQATGNMSTWGTDGDPDGQRQAWRFGGGWGHGGWAGSRYANVGSWPDFSDGWLGARGRSDHLQLDA